MLTLRHEHSDIEIVQTQANVIRQSPGFHMVGIEVFTKFFKENPSLVKKFGQIHEIGPPYNDKNKALAEHSLRAMGELFDIIEKAYTPEADLLLQIHAVSQKKLNVTHEQFKVLLDSVIEVLENLMQETFNRDAWTKALRYVLKGMKQYM